MDNHFTETLVFATALIGVLILGCLDLMRYIIDTLNGALKKHTGFEFRKYWQAWSDEDSCFSVVIPNTISDGQKVFENLADVELLNRRF